MDEISTHTTCMVCGEAIPDGQGNSWWRVWNDNSGRTQLEGWTYGRCSYLMQHGYALTADEQDEYAALWRKGHPNE